MATSSASDESSVFAVSDVCLSYGSHEVFRSLSLEVKRGEAFAVLGPGGSGKSTLLKLLSGLVTPEKGTVTFQGRSWQSLQRGELSMLRRRLGMTFQKSGLFDFMSCGENLHFPLRELTSLTRAEREAKIKEALADVGLSGQESLMVHEMSGGMQKRLGIARALVLSPEAILYDDPTAGLDPITSRAILELIVEARKKYRMTIVLVTSDPTQAFRVADRVGFLHDGRFLQTGTIEEIKASSEPAVIQFLHGRLEGPLTSGAG